jgi:hypothetical protein
MDTFGADSLFLAPEYLDNVNSISAALVGIAIGMFIMAWNISTFVLLSKYFKFLAATTNPFLKYCINNAVIPVIFILFYFFRAYEFTRHKELISNVEILFLAGGFLSGLIFVLAVSFIYFFRADRSIMRKMMPTISNPQEYITHLRPGKTAWYNDSLIRVEWYFDSHKLRPTRMYDTIHLSSSIHFSNVTILLPSLVCFAAFLLLITIGFFLDSPFFQIPAAASITIFFTILIGVAGAFSYFLQSWSIPYLIALLMMVNFFYKKEWIDPRNKAYGINYQNKSERPHYTKEGLIALCARDKVEADRRNMITILENWKKNQDSAKPLLVLLNTSGGGHRSATFTISMLQALDSITHGTIMKNIFLITGASGGMVGATYFRELYLQRLNGKNINLQGRKICG